MLKVLLGAAIGFVAAWFLDPDAGDRRRKTLQEKATSYVRKGGEEEAAAVQRIPVPPGMVEGDVTPTSESTVEEPIPAETPPGEEAVPGLPERHLLPRR
jgi:hypothetical protein